MPQTAKPMARAIQRSPLWSETKNKMSSSSPDSLVSLNPQSSPRAYTSNKTRYTHPRPPVPQRRPLRLNNPTRLARSIHLPRGIRLRQNKHHKVQFSPRCTPIRTPHLRPGYSPDIIPRNNLRLLLRNSACTRNECPSSTMPQARPTRIHRPRLHGQSLLLSRLLLRRLTRGITFLNEIRHRVHPYPGPRRKADQTNSHTPLCSNMFQTSTYCFGHTGLILFSSFAYPNTHIRE